MPYPYVKVNSEMPNYYSQFQEDKFIYENLKLPRNGTFIDVGAWDGVESSNTKFFEDELGWDGICIEPVRSAWEKCLANRKKTTTCINVAAGERFELVDFHAHPDCAGMSSLIPSPGSVPYKIQMVPVGAYKSDFSNLTLLSIDTEGTELAVWEGAKSLHPDIVIIEYLTEPHPPRDVEIVAKFDKDGYQEVHRTRANLIFVPK